ncbi:hypothetical protein AB0M95_06355 [Sphaerisporangium sp. NPDC051017]|uniref:hypothetical protein n=1 Tax=Sphaerisporangium sp. NPDC051017 TaxID=3154636 RepID=UPI003422D189
MVDEFPPPTVTVPAYELSDLRSLMAKWAQKTHQNSVIVTEHSDLIRCIYNRLEHFGSAQDDLITEVHDLRKRMIGVEAGVTDLRSQFADLRSDVNEIRADVTDLRTEVGEIKSTMVTKTELDEVKADLAGVKTDLAGVKTDLAGVKAEVAGVDGKMDLLLAHFQLN